MNRPQAGSNEPVSAMQGKRSDGLVVLHCPASRQLREHEWETHVCLAKRIAALAGQEFGGEYDAAMRYGQPLYFVPSDTLLLSEADRLGIGGEHQLFGGAVPHAFVATKTITHALVDEQAASPPGWSHHFGEQVRTHVLSGITAFDLHDLRRAALQLLAHGSIRMKLPDGIGGIGQSVVRSTAELDDFLHAMDEQALQRIGVVVEANLNEVTTYSVGQTLLGTTRITYCGTQKLTTSNSGKEVYGGSELTVVRGGFDQLLQLEWDEAMRTAISQACHYHAAALACYPGMYASRANYDVAQGWDDQGQWHSGVLEQSWRIGGASGAEIAALEAFAARPELQAVCASTTESYGQQATVPREAVVYYRGHDEAAGYLTKYSLIKDYGNPR